MTYELFVALDSAALIHELTLEVNGRVCLVL